ncbi:MAG: MaoC/PaaZ C-terminal domain-containing protein [Pseudomonadales bacterium]
MPLDARMVGESTRTFTHDVDARWLMAYAAGLGDLNPAYLDTQAGTVIAHPVFPVCLEWPVILSSHELAGYETVTRAESARGVHASHDLHLYRPIRAGERLTTRATIISLMAIRPGAAQMTRLDTTDASGALVCRTYQLGISRDVAVTGGSSSVEAAPDTPGPVTPDASAPVLSLAVAGGAAHTYTECARIWNPIHTDRAVALAAGLPDIILHGTATMALSVSALVNACLDGDPTRVRRLGGRFAAMVLMPSTLTVHVQSIADGVIRYQVLTEDGQPAFQNAFLCFDG